MMAGRVCVAGVGVAIMEAAQLDWMSFGDLRVHATVAKANVGHLVIHRAACVCHACLEAAICSL